MLLAAVATLLLRGVLPSGRRSLRLLAAGIGSYVVADMVFAYVSLHSGYHGGDAVDLLCPPDSPR